MRFHAILVICVVLLSASAGGAQDSADPVQELIDQERIRALVESTFRRVGEARRLYSDDTAFVDAYLDIAYELGTADPAVIPLLANETMQSDPATFYLVSYALSFQGTAEAIETLHAAIERADGEQSSFAKERKAHLIWALAVAGDVRAVRLADHGRHAVGDRSLHLRMSVLEGSAILTAPASLEILHAELSAEDLEPPEEQRRTLYSIRALANIGDPSSLPTLLAQIKSESVLARMEAAKGLALYPQKASVDAMLEALHDEAPMVSSYAAQGLLLQWPQGRSQELVKLLKTVKNPGSRRVLYRLLAYLDGPAALPLLAASARTADDAERSAVYNAAASIRSTEALDLLVDGLANPDGAVAMRMVRALAELDHPRARRVVLRAIDSPRWIVAQTASEVAVRERLPGAADAIRERLLKRELPPLVHNAAERHAAEWLLDRLVEYEDVAAIEGLEDALEVQRDGFFVARIETAVRQLKAARDAGEDPEKWSALAFDENPAMRMTAYRHLARMADADAAAKILAMAFGRVEPAEGEAVLDRIAELDSDPSRELVERVLTAPQYQRPELYSMRDTAAWAARRLGGERMRAALRRSIEMRHGRDIRPIIYYALLSGKESAALIEEFIVSRMRFKTFTRGTEYAYLRKMLLRLSLDLPLDFVDHPPSRLSFK